MSALVGISGKKRSGKDTFAARLVERHGFVRVAFADALREAALALDPIVETWADQGIGSPVVESDRLSDLVREVGWEEAKAHPEVRRTLQRFGVGIRELHPTFWIDVVARKSEALLADGHPVVVTDVRFPNEADWILAGGGGYLVRIERPGLASDDPHASETALDDFDAFDFRVHNDGPLDDLYRAADGVAGRLLLV